MNILKGRKEMIHFGKLLDRCWRIPFLLLFIFVFAADIHAMPTSIGLDAFSGNETVINFNSIADEQLITNQYTASGVTFSGAIYGLTNDGDIENYPNDGGGVIASNWLYSQGSNQGLSFTATFASPKTKVGFYGSTNDPDNTTVEVSLNGNSQGSVFFDTGPGGYQNVLFIGVEDPAGFNSVTVSVQNNHNGFISLDDFRFEDAGAQPRAIPTLSEWGMIIMSLLLAGSAVWMIRRRRIDSVI